MPIFNNVDEDEKKPEPMKKPVVKKAAEPDSDRAAFLARLNAMHAAGPRPMMPKNKSAAESRAQTVEDIFAAKLAVPQLA